MHITKRICKNRGEWKKTINRRQCKKKTCINLFPDIQCVEIIIFECWLWNCFSLKCLSYISKYAFIFIFAKSCFKKKKSNYFIFANSFLWTCLQENLQAEVIFSLIIWLKNIQLFFFFIYQLINFAFNIRFSCL